MIKNRNDEVDEQRKELVKFCVSVLHFKLVL